MKYTIHKYTLSHTGDGVIEMPRGAKLLHAAMQAGIPTVWALVDTTAPEAERLLRVVGTGHDCDSLRPGDYDYVDTFFDGPFVWHVFDLGELS